MAQMRRVVLLPTEAEEHPHTIRLSRTDKAKRGAIPLAMFWADPHSFLTQTSEVFMRLSCKRLLLLLGVALMAACHDATAPSNTINAQFILENVNGLPLPSILWASPQETTTVYWSTLYLNKQGQAVLSEHRRNVYQGVATEATYTNNYEYRLNGDQIQIGYFQPCPANAVCFGFLTGTIDGSNLALIVARLTPTTDIVYFYGPTLAL
jgi:hypothetical protein